MSAIRHTTWHLSADGAVDCLTGQLPAAVACSLPPLRITVTDGTDPHLAARLLRQLADEIERQDVAP